jgi:exosortase
MREVVAELRSVLAGWLAAAKRQPINAVLGLCLGATLLWSYGESLVGIFQHATSDVLWYHCLLVPFGAAWIWFRRAKSISEAPRGHWWGGGAMLILVAGLLQMAELSAGGSFFGGASLAVAVAAIVALLQGKRRLVRSLFPVGFLLLGVPVPKEAAGALGYPLQTISAVLTQMTCRVMGLPVLRDGVQLRLGDFSATIAGACSGMSSLFALLMLGAWILGFSRMRTGHKVLVALAILPAVVAANVARLVIMMVVALLLGGDVAMSFFHEGSDIVLFLIVLSFLIAAKLRLEGTRLVTEAPRVPATVTWTWD